MKSLFAVLVFVSLFGQVLLIGSLVVYRKLLREHRAILVRREHLWMLLSRVQRRRHQLGEEAHVIQASARFRGH